MKSLSEGELLAVGRQFSVSFPQSSAVCPKHPLPVLHFCSLSSSGAWEADPRSGQQDSASFTSHVFWLPRLGSSKGDDGLVEEMEVGIHVSLTSGGQVAMISGSLSRRWQLLGGGPVHAATPSPGCGSCPHPTPLQQRLLSVKSLRSEQCLLLV